jgi:ABC-type transporter Mla subunit MlaD
MALYDLEGHLIALARIRDGKVFLALALESGAGATFEVANLEQGARLENNMWQTGGQLQGTIATSAASVPHRAKFDFAAFEDHLALVAWVPAMGAEYDPATGQMEPRPFGLVMTARWLDESFARRMSRLSDTLINLFTGNGLSAGTLIEYADLQADISSSRPDRWSLDGPPPSFNEITLQNDGYFQGVLPLYSESEYLGAVAALCSQQEARANTWQMLRLLLMVFLGCLLFVLPLTVVFSKTLTKPIHRVIARLIDSGEAVADASNKIFSASHNLAEGATQQAASLQETAASLEQMTSATRQNADHAENADRLVKETNSVVMAADTSMEGLTASMNEIVTASTETAKIVKTIDEIAFQTNLLALNAAVEAARAGGAGSGFAVVADEVRSLALRAAEAARQTSEMIEGTAAKVRKGTELAGQTSEAFGKVSAKSADISRIITQIAAFSEEQAQGIERLNQAVAEIDVVVQRTATGAGDSTAASEKMQAQAEQMREMVRELVGLVRGQVDPKPPAARERPSEALLPSDPGKPQRAAAP